MLLGIASALPHTAALDQILNANGETILVAAIALVLIADWKGFLTLNGLIHWNRLSDGTRIVFGLGYLVFGPLLLVVYLNQIARHQPTPRRAPRPEPMRQEVRQ